MTAAEAANSKTRYLIVYFCILAIAGLQFVIASSSADPSQMFTRMLILACIEASLAVLFFMHLWVDSRGLLWFVSVFTIFVLLAMQYSWTDSYRLLNGVQWAK